MVYENVQNPTTPCTYVRLKDKGKTKKKKTHEICIPLDKVADEYAPIYKYADVSNGTGNDLHYLSRHYQ